MQDLYKENQYCMNFLKEEVEEYLLSPLRNEFNENKFFLYTKKSYDSHTEIIEAINFDGEVGNFSISFYGHQTSIYISDETDRESHSYTFNKEFMFIDDLAKQNMVSSATFENIVYEGSLRDKTHSEILGLCYKFIKLLCGSKAMNVEESIVSQTGFQYPKCQYVVKITKEQCVKSKIQLANILFILEPED